MEQVTVIIESPVKYDMPYSAGMYGHKKQKSRQKTLIEKILDKILDKISKGA